ncbi:MAG: STAS domain-containing protein [Rhodoferax sp.]|nr:MAG: STAS domain-containing protein [Rhodoferax sp.]
MAVKENSKGLLSRVANLIRKDDKETSDSEESRQDRGADTTQEALKARVEQKRRDDIIRRREFDHLRKIRSNGIVTSSYVAGKSQVYQSSGGYQEQERHNTVQKINDIEAQMSRNWWTRKGEETPSHLLPTRPLPLHASKPATSKPVIASVRMGADDPPEGTDLLDGFEFATAAPGTGASASKSVSLDVTHAQAFKPSGHDPVVIGFVPSVSAALDSGISGFSNSKLISIEMGVTLGDPNLQEASIRFAEGDSAGALVLLEQGYAAPDTREEAVQVYAGAIFDLHRSTGNKDAFDHFALAYAERFGTSPPEWACLPDLLKSKRAHGGGPRAELRSDEWVCPATLTADGLQQLNQLALRTSGTVHVHWDGLQQFADDVASPFADMLARWASKPLDLGFSGVPMLLKALKARTPGGDVRTDQAWWRLRLNAYRVLGMLDEFEQVALDFCMVYELSPPSWEAPVCQCSHEMAVSDGAALSETQVPDFDNSRASVFGLLSASESDVVEIDGEVLGDADSALAALRDGAKGSHQLVVSCSLLIRVDFAAAGSILNWVANLESQGCHVQFQDLSRLVAAFFNVIGINDHASVVLRAR